MGHPASDVVPVLCSWLEAGGCGFGWLHDRSGGRRFGCAPLIELFVQSQGEGPDTWMQCTCMTILGNFLLLLSHLLLFFTFILEEMYLARVGPEGSSLARLLSEPVTSYLHINVAGSRVAVVPSPLKEGREAIRTGLARVLMLIKGTGRRGVTSWVLADCTRVGSWQGRCAFEIKAMRPVLSPMKETI